MSENFIDDRIKKENDWYNAKMAEQYNLLKNAKLGRTTTEPNGSMWLACGDNFYECKKPHILLGLCHNRKIDKDIRCIKCKFGVKVIL